MKILLFLLAILAFVAGLLTLGTAKTSIHEMAGFVLFVISAVLISGAVVADAIDALPKKLEQLLLGKSPARTTAAASEHASTVTKADDRELMQQFGITFDGERYHFQKYKYDKLEDAVNYAKKMHT